jgi:septal ring factor EnvC (AmiA/AmiB activator)
MSEELQKEVEVWSQEKNRLALIVDGYTALTIDGCAEGPIAGYAVVTQARNVLRKERTQIEARRVELKATVLDVGRKIDKAAKELQAVINKKEQELQDQIDIVDKKERAKQDAEAQRKADALQARTQALLNVGVVMMPIQVSLLTDEDYESTLANATAQKEAQRIQREKEDQIRAEEMRKLEENKELIRAEQERLDRVKHEQEEEARKLDTQRREQEEERARIQKEEQERARKAEEEAQFAAIREREERERAEHEAQQARERAEHEAAEKQRLADLAAKRAQEWESTAKYRFESADMSSRICALISNRQKPESDAEKDLRIEYGWTQIIGLCAAIDQQCSYPE